LPRVIMADWIVAKRAVRLEHRAIKLGGQPTMAKGFYYLRLGVLAKAWRLI
jgi:hypothetical protein